jgi:hypothetical protein
MVNPLSNIQAPEPTGGDTIPSASGPIAHIAVALGPEKTRDIMSQGVIERASAARESARISS